MSALIALAILGTVGFYLIFTGIQRSTANRRYEMPRPRVLTATAQLGESLGWWHHDDMFGYNPWNPPDPIPEYDMTVQELEGRTETRTEAHVVQPPKDWASPGIT